MSGTLTIILVAIAIATLLNVGLKRINIPTIIGYIFTGCIIGMVFNIHVHGNEQLEHIAEFGIVFLMFTIGLELSIEEIKSRKRELFVYGALQVLLTGAVIALIAHFAFNVEQKASIIVGLGLALSSTAIVLKLFNETGEVKTQYGGNANGILIFQDIALIPILLMITIFTSADKGLSELLTETAINAAITLALLFVIGKFVLKRFFKVVASSESKEIYMGSILLVVVGASYIAHFFGFSYTLGAFIAGVMIADTLYKYQIEADLIPFRDILLGVFFVSVGMQIDMHVIQQNIWVIIGLVVGIMVLKAITIFAFLLPFMSSKKDAFKTGLSLAQVGEAALVIFSMMMASEMLDEQYVQVIIVTIVISMVLTPFILMNLNEITQLFFGKKSIDESMQEASIMENHIILCGYDSFGQIVSHKLDENHFDHQIITNNTDHYMLARQHDKKVFFGDPADNTLLISLQVLKASSVIIAMDDLEDVERVCASINLIDPKISIVAKVKQESELEALESFNLKTVLDANAQLSDHIVSDIAKSKLLAQQTSELKYLDQYDASDPKTAIKLLQLEQARLLDIVSKTFNGIRTQTDIMIIRAYYDSFSVLSEIVRNIITDLTNNNEAMNSDDYSRINLLLNNQHMFEEANESLATLAEELVQIGAVKQGGGFVSAIVEGLDTILLSLQDIATDFDEDDLTLLKVMTAKDSKGIERVRTAYLDGEHDFDAHGKVHLLSATNLTERMILLFGEIGQNYERLHS